MLLPLALKPGNGSAGLCPDAGPSVLELYGFCLSLPALVLIYFALVMEMFCDAPVTT